MKRKIKILNLTLIELVISLGILAAVASVTLSMMEESGTQQRFNRTYETGRKIQEVINAENSTDGISRFISDMGRLPVVISTADGKQLAELYNDDNSTGGVADAVKWNTNTSFSNTGTLVDGDPSFNFPDNFTTLKLPCGWAGPYMYNHRDTLKDGWNKSWVLLDSNNNPIETPGVGDFIYGVESPGSDGGDSETSWSEQKQTFKFNTSGTTVANRAELIVTIMVRDNSAITSVMRTPSDKETLTHAAWVLNTEYNINAIIKEATDGHFLFKCKGITVLGKGKSNATEPTWNITSAEPLEGNKITTYDNNIVWEYIGAASSEPFWKNYSYSKNDLVKDNSASVHAFRCLRIRPLSSGTVEFNKDYDAITNDGDIVWQCIYPEPNAMSHIRVAYFSPNVTISEKNISRLLVGHNGDHEDPPENLEDSNVEWDDYNQVNLKGLTPGSRKLYVYGFYKSGSIYRNKRGSDVLDLNLKPGVNRITVYLTNDL